MMKKKMRIREGPDLELTDFSDSDFEEITN